MGKANKIVIDFAIFALVLSFVNCQIPGPGRCPSGIKTVSEFDVDKYLGTWYEHSKYPAFFEIGGKCMQAVYGASENGSVSVINSQINKLTGAASNITGNAVTTEEPGKLIVKFPSVPRSGTNSNYWVLSTDYSNYSVVYSCSELLNNMMHAKIVWILTRERNPPQDVIVKTHNVLDVNNISKIPLFKTDQENCPIEP